MQAAASVLRRLKEPYGWNTGLYRMTHNDFCEKLEITTEESRSFGASDASGRNQNRKTWQVGIMGFEPMRGLEFKDYLAETRRRQTEAGRLTGAKNLPAEPVHKASEDKQASAQLMHALGLKPSEIKKWLK